MASQAFSGVGTLFQRSATINGVYATIAEVNSITGPGMSKDTIDVTSLDSTDGYREFIAGFKNAGTVQLSMNFTNRSYLAMKADFDSDNVVYYRIVFPDTAVTVISFTGLVTELPITVPTDDKVTMDVTIQITGPTDVDSGT
jgi:predicted secreted protein